MTPEESLEEERRAYEIVTYLAEQIAKAAAPIWHIGDGFGGEVIQIIEEACANECLPLDRRFDQPLPKKKKTVPGSLRKEIFERDKYRCVYCGDHKSLCLDHVIPESKGGPTTAENLVTACTPCNSSKRDKMPEQWRQP